MREVNFSIPNVNKASVHITTTLYDRRALDCTSTIPLVNSLNHLAYLTTSSGRIRDILVLDGGVERLVSILKEGRSTDPMGAWKWNLAFQCIVNIGVRGSEGIRSRVVQADIVPVIATILDNYIQVIDEQRAKAEAEAAQRDTSRLVTTPRITGVSRAHSYASEPRHSLPGNRQSSRRQRPPALEIPQPFTQAQQPAEDGALEATPTRPTLLTSPPDRTAFSRQQVLHRPHHHHHHHRSQDGRETSHRHHGLPPLATAIPSMDTARSFAIPPVRDADRLPSMLPALQGGNHSQPESPTTPSAAPQRVVQPSANHRPRRPSLRQLRSNSAESMDAVGDESAASGDDANVLENERSVMEVQAGVAMTNVNGDDTLLDEGNTPLTLAIADASEPQEAETFNITHRNTLDGSILNTNATPNTVRLAFSPVPPAPPVQLPSPALTAAAAYPSLFRNATSPPGMQAMEPRDEDVLMLLQLLAYVSKYSCLRPHFQATHLVPKLRINRETREADAASESDEDEEYLQPDDFNIFPLVEKFTVRHHSKDMQYWASVVMRNLCRRDDKRGGIRQCAYYACGRWEGYPRQFAKCRRCRRTKYCSKDCQKNAWVYHRHWCQAPS